MASPGSSESSKKTKNPKPKSNEEILLGFQKLRTEQRFLSTKLNELELELHEHRVVIDTLKDLDGDRKCFRMIGGILCERTVKDVLPILKTNEENLIKVVESLSQQLVAKGTEINKFKDENNVKFRHVDEFNTIADPEKTKSEASNAGAHGGGGVLVS